MQTRGLIIIVAFSLAAWFTSQSAGGDDGEWGILFYLSQGSDSGLYWMRPDAPEPELVVRYAAFESALLSQTRVAISPDSEWLAVSSSVSKSPYFRFTLYQRGSGAQTRLTSEGPFRKRFFWSPDSSRVAYLMEDWDGKVFIIDRTTGEERLIAHASDIRQRRGGLSYFINLDWSPDGRRLALNFIQESGLATISDLTLATVNADGSGLTRWLDDFTWALAPAWYSDTILYYICRARQSRLTALCALDLDRSIAITIRDFATLLPAVGFIKTLDVAPDGRVVFSFGDGASEDEIYLYNIDRRALINLSTLSGYRGAAPRWFYRTTSTGAD